MKKQFKFFIKKAVLFIVVFIIVDLIFGSIVLNLFFKQKSGKYARIMHSIKNIDEDILIFGSSTAVGHLIPRLFENELDRSCYNVGVLGQSIIFHTALQKMILERTKPKMIVLNIDYRWLYESQNSYDRLNDLHPYYWEYRNILKPILSLDSKFVDFKLLFRSYQTNSTHLHMLYYYFFPQTDYKGYKPLKGEMKIPMSKEVRKTEPGSIDENFLKLFLNFISFARENNVKLIFTVSPTPLGYDYSNNRALLKIKQIAKSEQVPLYDFSNDVRFMYKYNLFFKDGHHLNDEGAHLFSKIVIESIKHDTILQSEFLN